MSLFKKTKTEIVQFWQDKGGASGIEYAIVAAMVAVVIVAFISPISTLVKGIFTTIQASL